MANKNDHRLGYSVYELFVVGGRMVNGFDEEDAVKLFIELHPEANEAETRVALEQKMREAGWFDEVPKRIGSMRQPELVGYSLLEFYKLGKSLESDFSIDDAVLYYCSVHPDTKGADVRAELLRELAKPEQGERSSS